MPLIQGASRAATSANIAELVRSGRPQRQAVAIALRVARENARRHRAGGGSYTPPHPPFEERAEARGETERLPAGFIHSPVAGRTDQLPMSPAAGSFVIPADVVSGLQEGNSLAGAAVLDRAFASEPYGIRPAPRGHGSTIPHPPPAAHYGAGGTVGPHFAAHGGKVVPLSTAHDPHEGAPGSTPIIAAGGEYIVPADVVAYHPALGMGDPKNSDPKHRRAALNRGHRILEKWVNAKRAEIIKTMKGLPGPAR